MNLRWEAFRTGAALVIRAGRARRGHRFVVIDRDLRARRCVARLASQGMAASDISRALGRPLPFVLGELEKIQQKGC